MVKRVKRTRKRVQRDTDDDGVAALRRDNALRLKQMRGLKAEFDRVHRAGLDALRRKQFERVSAAILHEHRLIEKQSALIEEAMVSLDRHKVALRKL
jgi:hypothetical protein